MVKNLLVFNNIKLFDKLLRCNIIMLNQKYIKFLKIVIFQLMKQYKYYKKLKLYNLKLMM